MLKDFPENALSQHKFSAQISIATPTRQKSLLQRKEDHHQSVSIFLRSEDCDPSYLQFFRNTSVFHLFYDLQCSPSHSIMLLHLECREPAIGDLIVPEP
jgi:hypothetical protein